MDRNALTYASRTISPYFLLLLDTFPKNFQGMSLEQGIVKRSTEKRKLKCRWNCSGTVRS